MKLMIAFDASLLVLLSLLGVAIAQAPIVTIRLAKDQIAIVKTAPGITTRLVFPEQVTEIICGDLYDPANERGSFVVQRGGRDVFLKPVATKGVSNMFVKTGHNDENVYSFDLVIVTADQAYRIVNVLDTPGVLAAKVKPQSQATRITPPVVPIINLIDWKASSPATGMSLAAYALPGSADVPEPPLPQSPAAPSSEQLLARVPIRGDPIRRVRARYPEIARASGMNGEVVVEIIIDENGKVISAKPVSGPALLRQAAVDAALGWRYTPTRVDGAATPAVGTITFRFDRFADDSDGRVRANR